MHTPQHHRMPMYLEMEEKFKLNIENEELNKRKMIL